jgi:hypothetical protein
MQSQSDSSASHVSHVDSGVGSNGAAVSGITLGDAATVGSIVSTGAAVSGVPGMSLFGMVRFTFPFVLGIAFS